MKIKKLFFGAVNEFDKIKTDDYDEIKIISYPFLEGVRGDYVLIVGIKKEKR